MSLSFFQSALVKPARLLLAATLSLGLVACGGGGGSPGAVGGGTGSTSTTPGTPTTPVPVPRASVTLVRADGSPLTSLSGTQTGTVRAVLKKADGTAAANVIVKFAVSDPMVVFVPASATALTDASGVAVITIKPAAVTAAGAVALTVTATVDTVAVTASVNLAVGPGDVVFEPSLSLTVVGAGNVPVTSLAGSQSATLRALLKDSAGAVAANAIVQFSLSSPLLAFTPSSGSALTDANGVAVISIAPAAVTSAGAVEITATAVLAGQNASTTTNLTVLAGPLTVSSVAFVPAPSAPLPVDSSAALNIAITSGGQPAKASTGLVLSSLCVSDGTATLVSGAFTNGVQAATYVNKGCNRGTDVITATLGASSLSASVGVDPAMIGTILFNGSSSGSQALVLKGSGGSGRQESALLTFRVVDQNNVGLSGVPVTFSASTATGGLIVSPTSGITDASGKVTTTVTSGTVPTPVRVLAQATRNGKTITGLSDALIISTGLPIQKAMSLSVDQYNINGWNIDGNIAKVTVRLADQYGNPISDSTPVNFVTEGGAIGSSSQGGCLTVDGGCSVTLKSQNFRPLNGRVTVLAYVQGIENFVDTNGDGQYSCTNFQAPDGSVPATYRPLIDTCISGGEPFTDMGDPFLDAGYLGSVAGFHNQGRYGTLDGLYEAANGDLPFPFNHSVYSAAGNGAFGLNFIRATTEIVFSDDQPTLVRLVCTSTTSCHDWTAADGTDQLLIKAHAPEASAPGVVPVVVAGPCSAPKTVRFRLVDLNNNPLPFGTKLTIANPTNATVQAVEPDSVGSTSAIGGTIHSVVVTPTPDCKAGSFSLVTVAPSAQSTPMKYSINFKLEPGP